jgi:hypothetical protein
MDSFVTPQQQNLADGCRVELQGIVSRPEINGCKGIVIGEFDTEKQRWPVLVMKRRGRDEEMLLRPVNLVLSAETDTEDDDHTETTVRVMIGNRLPESRDTSCSKNDDSDSSSSSDENGFKYKLKISQNMEQPYRSLSGAPLMSFFGSSILFPQDLELKYKVCHSTACPLREGVSSEQLTQAFKDTKLRECSKCRDTWYCSRKCQLHDWEHGGHRMQCVDNMKLSEAATLASSDSNEESETELTRVKKAMKTGIRLQPLQNLRGACKRVAKHSSRLTFEEKCTMEFLYSCGTMQMLMSDNFHRRANSLPPADSKSPPFSYAVPVTRQVPVMGRGNTRQWSPLASKFKSWMLKTCNEGPSLNFRGSIPGRILPHLRIVVCNAIELLRSWEPQESDNWAMQREAAVMTNLIAGFGHQKCFADEILTPGAQLHCYVQLLLQWCAWRGPVAHEWSCLMQLLLSALLSGMEISETIYRSPISVNVAVIEPVCNNFVAILAGDVYRFRSYKPFCTLSEGQQIKQLKQIIDRCATASEVIEIHAIHFFDQAATREIQACLHARRIFPNLDLYPLWRLAAFHKHQILSIGAVAIKSLHDHVAVYDKLLTTAASSQ